MIKYVENEQTGQTEAQFSAKLLMVSEKVLKNVNGTPYRVVGIEFEDNKGKTQKASATMWETNYQKGVEIGKNYLATAVAGDENRAFIKVSHLENIDNRATVDMFGLGEEAEANVTAPETVENKMN